MGKYLRRAAKAPAIVHLYDRTHDYTEKIARKDCTQKKSPSSAHAASGLIVHSPSYCGVKFW